MLLEDIALHGRVNGDGFNTLLSIAASISSMGGLFVLFALVKTDAEDDLSASSGEAVSHDAPCGTVRPATIELFGVLPEISMEQFDDSTLFLNIRGIILLSLPLFGVDVEELFSFFLLGLASCNVVSSNTCPSHSKTGASLGQIAHNTHTASSTGVLLIVREWFGGAAWSSMLALHGFSAMVSVFRFGPESHAQTSSPSVQCCNSGLQDPSLVIKISKPVLLSAANSMVKSDLAKKH